MGNGRAVLNTKKEHETIHNRDLQVLTYLLNGAFLKEVDWSDRQQFWKKNDHEREVLFNLPKEYPHLAFLPLAPSIDKLCLHSYCATEDKVHV